MPDREEPKGRWVEKDGHPEWQTATKDGESSSFAELPEYLNKPVAKTGHRWGGWIYESESNTLHYDDGVNRYEGVDLGGITDAKTFVG